MEVPDPMGGIVQSVTPSMQGKLNSTCVLVLLFIFKLHFLNTCFSHVQCRADRSTTVATVLAVASLASYNLAS